ncbi:MAG TPA: VOC family protein [Conexibacter sp.]|nr:VOC family protein [Conexibacter sp.]
MDITRLAHCAFETPDVGRLADHYEHVVGLRVAQRDADGTAHLAVGAGPPAILLHPAEQARLRHVALELAPGVGAADAAAHLRQRGVAAETATDAAPGAAAQVDFEDAGGHAVRLIEPASVEDVLDERPAGGADGIAPEKLGHVARRVSDVQAVCAFYEDALGFRVSDWIGDFFVFMRCNPEHHTVNFVRSPSAPALDHLAFQVHDAAHLTRACDVLASHGIPLIWGPGRHGAGHNLYAYYRNPDDQIVELFCDLDVILDERLGAFDPRPWHEDLPQRPKVWDPEIGANQWGIGVPPEMFR